MVLVPARASRPASGPCRPPPSRRARLAHRARRLRPVPSPPGPPGPGPGLAGRPGRRRRPGPGRRHPPPAHRPDGRPYVWATSLASNEVATYAIAWPYHCTPEQACPRAAPWRVLTVRAVTAEGPAARQRVREVARRLVDVRPITNALPEDVFELEFPEYRPWPGTGVHAEDIEPTYLLKGQLGVLRDCLS